MIEERWPTTGSRVPFLWQPRRTQREPCVWQKSWEQQPSAAIKDTRHSICRLVFSSRLETTSNIGNKWEHHWSHYSPIFLSKPLLLEDHGAFRQVNICTFQFFTYFTYNGPKANYIFTEIHQLSSAQLKYCTHKLTEYYSMVCWSMMKSIAEYFREWHTILLSVESKLYNTMISF